VWIYSQSYGQLSRDGVRVGCGYSGCGAGLNNPELQDEHSLGPIPRGTYYIGKPRDTETHGPFVLPLTPVPGTQTFGRSGFLIHGDNSLGNHTASKGCIVMGPVIRHAIASSGDFEIQVTE
jgi:hypothetical protein